MSISDMTKDLLGLPDKPTAAGMFDAPPSLDDFSIDTSQVKPPSKPKGEKKYLLSRHDREGNIPPELGEHDYIFCIDSSTLDQACGRAHEFKLVYGRTTYPTAALTQGKAIHNGLDMWYKEGPSNDPKLMARIYRTIWDSFEDFEVPMDEYRTPGRAIDLFQKYVAQYGLHEPFNILRDAEQQPLIELPFVLPLGVLELNTEVALDEYTLVDPKSQRGLSGNLRIDRVFVHWIGRIDGLIEDRGIWVFEHKTASIMGYTYWKDFETRLQTQGYTWAAQKILNRTVNGVLVNVLYSRPPRKDGSYEYKLERQFFYYRPEQLEEWEHNTMTLIAELFQRLVAGNFPAQTLWCVNKFGVCPYHDVCTANEEARLHTLFSDLYADNTWSPLDV